MARNVLVCIACLYKSKQSVDLYDNLYDNLYESAKKTADVTVLVNYG